MRERERERRERERGEREGERERLTTQQLLRGGHHSLLSSLQLCAFQMISYWVEEEEEVEEETSKEDIVHHIQSRRTHNGNDPTHLP